MASSRKQLKKKTIKTKFQDKIKALAQENQNLKKKNAIQKAVLESIEDVNRILGEDSEGKKLLWANGFPHNVSPELAKKIQQALKKNEKIWGWQSHLADACSCTRQRIGQIVTKDLSTWNKPDNSPKVNKKQCSPEMENLIIFLVRQDFDAPYNLTAKHAAMITGETVSAQLVIGVRKRNGLEKKNVSRGPFNPIRTSYNHVVSVDVVREGGKPIFGFIQDKTKIVCHYLAKAHTAEMALEALKWYIENHGKPDAIRSDHGSEFRGEFEAYVDGEDIPHIQPLPYNPRANGFIERYFRTLRKTLFRRLKRRHIEITQEILNDFAFLWNHCRQVQWKKEVKTPAEFAGELFPQEMLEKFEAEEQTIGGWTFLHLKGVHGLLHAYLPGNKIRYFNKTEQQKVA